VWEIHAGGVREYRAGRNDWAGAARMAAACDSFREDVEEEIVADELRSCYNCRYRRWSATSFSCCRPGF